MKAIVFDSVGAPLEVLYVAEIPIPRIEADEVLIRMIAASISPGDFLFIQSLYPEPKKPRFPRQIAGNHGMGIVERAGRNVTVEPGTLVAFSYYGSWAEYAAIPVQWLIPLPASFPIEKGAQLFNLITAWDLLEDARVGPGEWLALTAGHSSISRMVGQFAEQRSVRVMSVVRRSVPGSPMSVPSANVLDLTTHATDLSARIGEITHGKGINALIDNVGGPVTGELIRGMAFGGRVIINGVMSEQRFELHNQDILMKGLEIKAHVYRYFFDPPRLGDEETLQQIIATSGRADFTVTAAGLHPLEDFRDAISATLNCPGRGKHFLAPMSFASWVRDQAERFA